MVGKRSVSLCSGVTWITIQRGNITSTQVHMRVETDCGNLTRTGHIKNDLRFSKPWWYKWNPKNVFIFDHLFTFWESFYGGEFTQTEYYDSCCSHHWVQLLMPFVLYESNQIIQSEHCCLWKHPLLLLTLQSSSCWRQLSSLMCVRRTQTG